MALSGLSKALHARLSQVIRFRVDPRTGDVTFDDSLITSELPDHHHNAWSNHLKDGHRRDLFFSAIKRRLLTAKDSTNGMAYARSDLVPDQAWYNSELVTEMKIPMNLDDCAASVVRDGSPGRPHGAWIKASLHRAHKQPKFTSEEVQLIHSYLVGISPLLHGLTNGSHHDAVGVVQSLSPRYRELTYCLVKTGLPGKLIADRMKLKEQSVHTYCKRVYKRFGVSTRDELQALCQNPGVMEALMASIEKARNKTRV